jgi:hypothetical protein
VKVWVEFSTKMENHRQEGVEHNVISDGQGMNLHKFILEKAEHSIQIARNTS